MLENAKYLKKFLYIVTEYFLGEMSIKWKIYEVKYENKK